MGLLCPPSLGTMSPCGEQFSSQGQVPGALGSSSSPPLLGGHEIWAPSHVPWLDEGAGTFPCALRFMSGQSQAHAMLLPLSLPV